MTPYLICYLILVGSLATGLLLDKLRVAAIIAFVPMFLLIALRGIVGTDSAVYMQAFDTIRYKGFLASDFEPGFTLLVEVLTWFFRDPFDILIVLSCATAIIMLGAGLLLERSPFLFMTIVLPYFLIDMSMNGLRYGLAFAVVALGAAALARGRLTVFIACSVVAASIQVSSLLLAASLWALMEARIRTFLAIGLGLIVAFAVFGDYVGDKLSQNSDISGIGGLSGVAPLLATAAIIGALLASEREKTINNVVLALVLAMQIASFFIARQYYAGLRLQGLFLFVLYLLAATLSSKSDRDFVISRLSLIIFAMSFALLSASRLKNFNDDVMNISPFNPYYFASELSH